MNFVVTITKKSVVAGMSLGTEMCCAHLFYVVFPISLLVNIYGFLCLCTIACKKITNVKCMYCQIIFKYINNFKTNSASSETGIKAELIAYLLYTNGTMPRQSSERENSTVTER